jgi:hypothetical protein
MILAIFTVPVSADTGYQVSYKNFFNGVAETLTVAEGTEITLPTVADFADTIKWGYSYIVNAGKTFTEEWVEWKDGYWVPFDGVVDGKITVTSNLTLAPVAKTVCNVGFRVFDGYYSIGYTQQVIEGRSIDWDEVRANYVFADGKSWADVEMWLFDDTGNPMWDQNMPITKNIVLAPKYFPVIWKLGVVVEPNCTLEGYTYNEYLPTGERWYYDYVPALGHLYDEDADVTDDGYGFYFTCRKCGWAGYLRYEDGTVISSAYGDELVKRIDSAVIDPAAFGGAIVTDGFIGKIVTFYIKEIYTNGTTADIEYKINIPATFSSSINIGRYMVDYEIFSGVITKLEIGDIIYYSHGK